MTPGEANPGASQLPRCGKCGGEMQVGFIADFSYGAILVQRWVESEPVKQFLGGVKTPREKSHETRTFRCTNCGYLESYAPETIS
jgi:hypothetical protein